MNSSYHWTQQVRLMPYPGTTELFRVGITYDKLPAEQVFSRVHIPTPLQEALRADVAPVGVHLLSLKIGGAASTALPDAPEHVVVGVTAQDGSRVWHLPRPWATLRRRALAVAAIGAASVAALAPFAVHSGSAAVAALAAVATLGLSRVLALHRAVRFKPFSVSVEVGRPAG